MDGVVAAARCALGREDMDSAEKKENPRVGGTVRTILPQAKFFVDLAA